MRSKDKCIKDKVNKMENEDLKITKKAEKMPRPRWARAPSGPGDHLGPNHPSSPG